MEEYYQKYAKPLGKLSIFDLQSNLNTWKDNLKDELEGILYLRNGLNFNNSAINNNSNRLDLTSKSKLIDIINKLESLVLKEIECISEFSIKLTSSNSVLIETREKYEKNKNSITDTICSFKPIKDNESSRKDISNKFDSNNFNSNFKIEREKMEQGREWLEKLNKDLDEIDKDTSKTMPRNIHDISGIEKSINLKDNYSVDKDIDKLERQFYNLQKIAEDSNYQMKDLDITNISKSQKTIPNIIQNKTTSNEKIIKKTIKEKNKLTKSKSINKTNSLNNNNLNLNNSLLRNSSKFKKPTLEDNSNLKTNQSNSKIKPNTTKNSINYCHQEKDNLNIDISNISQSYLKEKLENNNHEYMNISSGRLSYNHIKNFTEELERIKNFCKEIKKSQENNCIMENEKRTFDKMKNEYIKLSADMNIMKEDIKELSSNFHSLIKRVNFLEEENKNLRMHNKNLIKLIQMRKDYNLAETDLNDNFNDDYYNEQNNGNYIQNYTDNINKMQNKFYQTTFKNNPIESNINKYPSSNQFPVPNSIINTIPNNINNKISIENNFSTPISDLSAFSNINNTSSNEMMMNIQNNNLTYENKKSKNRFIIQKDDLDLRINNTLHNQSNKKEINNINYINNNRNNSYINNSQTNFSNRNFRDMDNNNCSRRDFTNDNFVNNNSNMYENNNLDDDSSYRNNKSNNYNNQKQMINNHN